MRAAIVYNPISGAGRARGEARRLARAVDDAGHEADLVATRLEPPADWLDPALAAADVVAIVGGDGAVRMAAASVARAGVPLHHHPMGTENLFARAYGMARDAAAFVRTLGAHARGAAERRGHDLWRANGVPFTIMASAGLDADVVQDLAARRTGGISHLSYAMPILRTALRWRAPRFRVFADDAVAGDGAPAIEGTGVLVVANLRAYGGRLDPAPDARADDGLVDAVLLPAAGARGVALSALRARLRRLDRGRGVARVRAGRLRIEIEPAARFQVDGDPPRPPSVNAPVAALAIEPMPHRLQVLLPAGG